MLKIYLSSIRAYNMYCMLQTQHMNKTHRTASKSFYAFCVWHVLRIICVIAFFGSHFLGGSCCLLCGCLAYTQVASASLLHLHRFGTLTLAYDLDHTLNLTGSFLTTFQLSLLF